MILNQPTSGAAAALVLLFLCCLCNAESGLPSSGSSHDHPSSSGTARVQLLGTVGHQETTFEELHGRRQLGTGLPKSAKGHKKATKYEYYGYDYYDYDGGYADMPPPPPAPLSFSGSCLQIPGFSFISTYDSGDNDIGLYKGNVSALANICNSKPGCQSFNTNGWVKYYTRPPRDWYSWTSEPCFGMYIRIPAKCQDIPGYSFISTYDSSGSDIGQLFGDAATLARRCTSLADCAGFNTNGWVTEVISKPQEWTTWTRDPCKGLYIRMPGYQGQAQPPPPSPPTPQQRPQPPGPAPMPPSPASLSCPALPGYVRFINADHPGADIRCIQGTNTQVAAALCNAAYNCLAFNVDYINHHSCIKTASDITSYNSDLQVCFYTKAKLSGSPRPPVPAPAPIACYYVPGYTAFPAVDHRRDNLQCLPGILPLTAAEMCRGIWSASCLAFSLDHTANTTCMKSSAIINAVASGVCLYRRNVQGPSTPPVYPPLRTAPSPPRPPSPPVPLAWPSLQPQPSASPSLQPQPSALSPLPPAKATYAGCFKQPLRTNTTLGSSQIMTNKMCAELAAAAGYKVFATGAGIPMDKSLPETHCLALKAMPAAASEVLAIKCSSLCAGDPTQICGGKSVFSVYSFSAVA